MNLNPVGWLSARFGGPARTQVIVLLAVVLGINNADMGAIGAMADILEKSFNISETEIGLLVTASSLLSACTTLFFGWLVDRMRRTRLLSMVLLIWGALMALCGAAESYNQLLLFRLALGTAAGVTYPAIASLIGDFFPTAERGQIYGYIISGELIGTGFGYLISGEMAVLSWRLGFWVLSIPPLLLAWLLHRLPEPVRGGAGRLARGEQYIDAATGKGHTSLQPGQAAVKPTAEDRLAGQKVQEAGIQPRPELLPDENPARKSFRWAVHYVLRIPTNRVLIIASALGYFYFAGIRTFGVQFAIGRYSISHSIAILLLLVMGIGAVLGVVLAGRLGDRWLAHGDLVGRVRVATYAYFAGVALFIVPLITRSLDSAIPLLFLATACLGAVNSPLDAARLDIMHPNLWGRAEGVAFMLRSGAEALAPLLFGFLADQLDGNEAQGLRDAFLIMLVPLVVSGIIAAQAFRTYPRDVATAEAYSQRTLAKES